MTASMNAKGSDGRPQQVHIDQAVIENYGLNHNAGWLYVVIVAHVNGKTGVAFPGLARLAKLTGMSKPTVVKYMKVLESKGLIEVNREKIEGTNEHDVNHYRVLPVRGCKTDLPPNKDEVVKPVDNGSQTALPQVVKPVDNNHLEFNQTELTSEPSGIIISVLESSSSETMATMDSVPPTPEKVMEKREPAAGEQKIWDGAFGQLELQFDTQTFGLVFRGAQLLYMDGETYVIGLQGGYARQQCADVHDRLIRRIMSDCSGAPVTVRYEELEAMPPDGDVALFERLGVENTETTVVSEPAGLTLEAAQQIAAAMPGVRDPKRYGAKIFTNALIEGKAKTPAKEPVV